MGQKQGKEKQTNNIINYLNGKNDIFERISDLFTRYDDVLKITHPDLLKDRTFVLELVSKYDGRGLEFTPNFQNDRDVVLEAVKQKGEAIFYCSKELQFDREVVLEALKNSQPKRNLRKYENQKRTVLEYVKKEEFGKDQELIIEVSKKYFHWMEYASDELLRDRNFILDYIRTNDSEFVCRKYIKNVLQHPGNEQYLSDREIIFEAVKRDGMVLKISSKELLSDRELVLEAIKENGKVIDDTDEWHLSDKEVVLLAISNDKHSCNVFHLSDKVSEELRNDKEVILKAVQAEVKAQSTGQFSWDVLLDGLNKIESFSYASDALKGDREFVLQVVKIAGCALEYADKILQNDEEIVTYACLNHGNALEFVSDDFKNNKKFVMRIITHSKYVFGTNYDYGGRYFGHVGDELKRDKEIITESVKHSKKYGELSCVESYMDEELKKDEEFINLLKELKKQRDSKLY